jgi:hypothetical protein
MKLLENITEKLIYVNKSDEYRYNPVVGLE